MIQALFLTQYPHIYSLYIPIKIILPLAIPTIIHSRILFKHLIKRGLFHTQTRQHHTRPILFHHRYHNISIVINSKVELLGDEG